MLQLPKFFMKINNGDEKDFVINLHTSNFCTKRDCNFPMGITKKRKHICPSILFEEFYIFCCTHSSTYSRDIHIECSKQFKSNLYFYGSGQNGPFWAELKLF